MTAWGLNSAKAYGDEGLAKPGWSGGTQVNILPHEADCEQESAEKKAPSSGSRVLFGGTRLENEIHGPCFPALLCDLGQFTQSL